MIKNFIHILKRFKTSSILNILGLSVAIFIFLVVAIQIYHDITFNSYFQKCDKVYQLVELQKTAVNEEYNSYLSGESMTNLIGKYPEIKNYCYILSEWENFKITLIGKDDDKQEGYVNITSVTKGFQNMFQPQIIEGNMADFSETMNNAIISKKTSIKLFGKESPIEKIVELPMIVEDIEMIGENRNINVYAKKQHFTIKAVYEDFSANTSFNNGFIICQSEKQHIGSNVYLEIDKQGLAPFREKIKDKNLLEDFFFIKKKSKWDKEESVVENSLELLPIKNIQTNYPQVSSKGKSKTNVYFLLIIGLFSLFIAYINFVNFATAMAPARIKAVNIRIIQGADKNKLRFVIASEALLFTLVSCLLALLYLAFFQEQSISQIFTANMSLVENIVLVASLFLVLLFLGFIVGLYPAFYVTNFNMVTTLNVKSVANIGTSRLRNTLILLQFVVALCFISIAIFITCQYRYMSNYSLGFDKNNILFVPVYTADLMMPDREKNLNVEIVTFIKEVMNNPIIEEYTASKYIMGGATGGNVVLGREDGYYSFNTIECSNNFITFFDIKVIEQRNIDVIDNVMQLYVNERFIELHHVQNGLYGMQNRNFDWWSLKPTGIVKDFHYTSLREPINSLVILTREIEDLNYVYFKLTQGAEKEAIEHIENTWKKFSNKDIDLNFLDEKLNDQYKDQENLAKIISIVSLIIILIAIMGVYGLIIFNTKYRIREIAIRKANGAEVSDILKLLNKGLLSLFAIANIISIPIIYLIVNTWLQQFPIRIDIYWWVFLLGAFIVLVIILITVSWQSYKAATQNPVETLKSE